jgi:hypothetical protein
VAVLAGLALPIQCQVAGLGAGEASMHILITVPVTIRLSGIPMVTRIMTHVTLLLTDIPMVTRDGGRPKQNGFRKEMKEIILSPLLSSAHLVAVAETGLWKESRLVEMGLAGIRPSTFVSSLRR